MVQEAGGDRRDGSKGRRRRRPRRLFWVALVLVVLGVWVAYAGVQLLHARKDAQVGIDKLERLRSTMSPDTLLEGDDVGTLKAAKAQFDAANRHATNPALIPMRVLPFVGRQVRSVDKLTAAASDVSDIAVRQIAAARSVVDTTSVASAQRVALVSQMARIASDAAGDLADVDLGPSHALVAPLDRAHRRFAIELDALRGSAHNITLASTGIEQLLRGPGRYLVFAANNSEMRIGSGAFLSVGVLTTRDGQLDLGDIKSTTAYPVPAGAVPVDGRPRRQLGLAAAQHGVAQPRELPPLRCERGPGPADVAGRDGRDGRRRHRARHPRAAVAARRDRSGRRRWSDRDARQRPASTSCSTSTKAPTASPSRVGAST